MTCGIKALAEKFERNEGEPTQFLRQYRPTSFGDSIDYLECEYCGKQFDECAEHSVVGLFNLLFHANHCRKPE